MITADMREYNYFLLGAKDEYAQETITENTQGAVRMTIYPLTQVVGTSIKYKDATFIGFTQDRNINDSYIIQYGDKKLKVLYPVTMGRFTQVFLSEM